MNVEFRALHGPSDWGWIQQQVNIHRVDDTSGVMAIDSDKNETIAALVTDNWTANSVQAHFMVTDNTVFRHGFLEECNDYVFNYAGRKVLYALVPGNNEKAIKLNKHIGFTEKMRFDDAFAPGVDYLVMELKKANSKYLPKAPTQYKEADSG